MHNFINGQEDTTVQVSALPHLPLHILLIITMIVKNTFFATKVDN